MKTKIVVVVSGGVASSVYANLPAGLDVEVEIVDFDDLRVTATDEELDLDEVYDRAVEGLTQIH